MVVATVVEVAPVRDRIAPNTCCPLPHPSFEAIRKGITAEVGDMANLGKDHKKTPYLTQIRHKGTQFSSFLKCFENSTSKRGCGLADQY